MDLRIVIWQLRKSEMDGFLPKSLQLSKRARHYSLIQKVETRRTLIRFDRSFCRVDSDRQTPHLDRAKYSISRRRYPLTWNSCHSIESYRYSCLRNRNRSTSEQGDSTIQIFRMRWLFERWFVAVERTSIMNRSWNLSAKASLRSLGEPVWSSAIWMISYWSEEK